MISNQLEDQRTRQRVEGALAGLTDQQRKCLKLAYGLDGCDQATTGAATARAMGVSYQRFRRVHRLAIARIAHCILQNKSPDPKTGSGL